jgi:DNA-binding transcriptional MerR regulator
MVTKEHQAKKLMRISEAAKVAGVRAQTVEYYIMLGLIVPLRAEGGRGRRFDSRLVSRIRLIRRLNQSGYTLQSIRETYLRRK